VAASCDSVEASVASACVILVDALPLLQPKRRLALLDLRTGALGAERIEGTFLAQLVGREHRQQLTGLDRIALLAP
jgi:hypothetical protein